MKWSVKSYSGSRRSKPDLPHNFFPICYYDFFSLIVSIESNFFKLRYGFGFHFGNHYPILSFLILNVLVHPEVMIIINEGDKSGKV